MGESLTVSVSEKKITVASEMIHFVKNENHLNSGLSTLWGSNDISCWRKIKIWRSPELPSTKYSLFYSKLLLKLKISPSNMKPRIDLALKV